MTKLIIDGNNIAIACYSVIVRGEEPTEDQIPVIYELFNKMVRNLGNKFNTSEIYIAWDGHKGSSWRKESNSDYKATRGELNHVLKTILRNCKNNKYKNVHVPEAEGDDTIASLSRVLEGEKIVVSSDKDFIQLVQRGYITSLYNFVKKEFREIPEHDIIMEKAIVGDSSDNIKGVQGIGIKRFLKLYENNYKGLTSEQLEVIERNKQIIDLDKNPNVEAINKSVIDILGI